MEKSDMYIDGAGMLRFGDGSSFAYTEELDKELHFIIDMELYGRIMRSSLKKEGEAYVWERLHTIFEGSTLKFFPEKLTFENLYDTIVFLKPEDIVYRKSEDH